ncbi:MAG: HAMP domain-containing sensor histidine kinase [Bacteroidota bacterium]
MNLYSKKQKWKWVLFIMAILIVFTSLWYTNHLVNDIKNDEKKKVSLWAEAVQKKAGLVKFTNDLFQKLQIEEHKKAELYALATKQLSADVFNVSEFVLKVLQDNTTVPVILTDNEGNITASRNFDSIIEHNDEALKMELAKMKTMYEPVVIEYYKGKKNYLYHKDSRLFSDIKVVFDSLIRSFISDVAINSAAVPVIYTDSTKSTVLAIGNIDSLKINTHEKLAATIKEMELQNIPIEVDLGGGFKNYIFYEQSPLLTQLKYYPYVQFGVIGIFLLIAYILFSTSRKAEQDQVWVGMSKETAHQLGTPLSSLMAWIDHLRESGTDESIVSEMNRDVVRLNMITDRFSKIGSQPTLQDEDVCLVVKNAMDYLKQRTSRNVKYILEIPDTQIHAQLSVPLFEWVIENICKNAVDAMDGKGEFKVTIIDIPEGVAIDMKDNGKGIPKSKHKSVFKPGYTTKKRGWGLGLSLCKRIIENYHDGKIFVLQSEEGKGTTFRIVLKRG